MSLLAWHPCVRHISTAVVATTLALLLGCASRPVAEMPVQRFESALSRGAEKLAAGDLAQAATAFAQAEQVAALFDRRALRMQALFAMGSVAALAEQDTVALQTYTQALTEAQALGDAHSAGIAHAGMADALRHASDSDAALQHYTQALAPQGLRSDSTERLQARMGLALVWHAKGQTAAALDALGALESQLRASPNALLPGVLVNQAAVLQGTGEQAAALAKAQEALALDRRQANPAVLALDLELLGNLYQANQNTPQAKDSWARAQRIAQVTGQGKLLVRVQQALAVLR
jgi:tetratricopeptide (TPR) repeat protein